MYLALRDIRFAKGRFILMGGVIALITLLLVMLSGLTAGLAWQNTSAIDGLRAAGLQRVAFGAPPGNDPKVSFTESQVTADQLEAHRAGGAAAEPLGILQARATAAATASVALFGTETGSSLPPSPVRAGETVLGADTAEALGVGPGDSLSIGGTRLRVAATAPETFYSHTPVAWIALADWQRLAHLDDTGPGPAPIATAIVSDASADAAEAADAAAGTVSTDVRGSYAGLPSYSSENGSLLMMQAFLYGISALVIVAFLAVWTVQRTRDIAVLKALGAGSGFVLGDALGQAGLVLAGGAAVGGLVAAGAGLAVAGVAPFVLTAATVLLPVLGVVLLGLAGAAVTVSRVTRVDPLLALGGS